MSANPIIGLIVQGARQRGLDPQAVLAVARQEGLSGRVGDQGTSFGPFQLHRGGALPGGIRNPQAWAQSPAGINYALDRIAGVARGKRGAAAVNAIVRGFERPADPNGEVARALGGNLGSQGNALVTLGGVLPGGQNTRFDGLDPLLLGVLRQNGLSQAATSLLQPTAQVPVAARAPTSPPTSPGIRGGKSIRWIEKFAAPYGLNVTSTTGGKHAQGSYHYQGRAVDFGGNPTGMAALARAALQRPKAITEMFYTGPGNPGYFIKNGRAFPNSQLDPGLAAEHTNHVHLAR